MVRSCTVLMAAAAVLLGRPVGAAEWPAPRDGEALPASCRRPDSRAGDPVLPFVLRKVKLEDVAFYARGGAEMDTFVRFSPDGRLLAIGTFLGHLKLLDVYSGELLWEKKIAEGMVKQIDFSPDGKRLYFAEQSVDGFVYSADAATGKIAWTFRLADDLQTSAPAAKDNIYGIYQLPGCYRLKTLAGGDVLVLGVHAWGDHRQPGAVKRLSRVYRLSPDGKPRWAFPADGPAPQTLIYLDTDPAGRRVALLSAGASTGNRPPLAPGSIGVLDGQSGRPLGVHTFQPLKPHFDEVGLWRSVSVGKDGHLAAVGAYDGRTFLIDLETVRPTRTFAFGTPVVISNVPVSASSATTHIAPDGIIYLQTGNSSVPYSAAVRLVVAPPGPHPHANTIDALAPDGDVKWRYRSGHDYQGFCTSDDGRWLLTAVKREDAGQGPDAGAMLFDTHRPGGGTAKLVYYYQVRGLTFFHADIARDGSAFAICETPYKDPRTGKLIGRYQVHVVR